MLFSVRTHVFRLGHMTHVSPDVSSFDKKMAQYNTSRKLIWSRDTLCRCVTNFSNIIFLF